MKTYMNRIAMFAAGALLAGTMANAQERLTANVPFDFHVSGRPLPAGTYDIAHRSAGASNMYVFRNAATGKAGMVAGGALSNEATAPGEATLVFACVKSNCALASVRTVNGTRHYYPNLKLSGRDKEALAMVEVPLHGAKGD